MNRLVVIVLAILVGWIIYLSQRTNELRRNLEKTQLLYSDSEEDNKVYKHEILLWKERALKVETSIEVLKDAQKKNDSIVKKIYKEISRIKTPTCGPVMLEEVQIIK